MVTVIDLTEDDLCQIPVRCPNSLSNDGIDDDDLCLLTDAAEARVIDLQISSTSSGTPKSRTWRLPSLEEDHMQEVVDLLLPQTKFNASPSTPQRHKAEAWKKPALSTTVPRSRKSLKNGPNTAQRPNITFKTPSSIRITSDVDASSPHTFSATGPITSRVKRARQPFNFLQLPPEIRNRIYNLLLTTYEPIEMTRARQTTAKREDEFAKCKTSKARRSFKTIFLEILQTSKQVHQEATTILYGTNVFKFRSDHKAGYRDPKNILPHQYLGLLRLVKVSVISREAGNGQDQWVADLLNSAFSKEKTTLDMFELTWFGWQKFRLTKDGVVCQALLNLNVQRSFSVKIAGDARMKTEMLQELTDKMKARKVEIKRPVFEVMKNNSMVEVSDNDE